jgi:hypothetical protein
MSFVVFAFFCVDRTKTHPGTTMARKCVGCGRQTDSEFCPYCSRPTVAQTAAPPVSFRATPGLMTDSESLASATQTLPAGSNERAVAPRWRTFWQGMRLVRTGVQFWLLAVVLSSLAALFVSFVGARDVPAILGLGVVSLIGLLAIVLAIGYIVIGRFCNLRAPRDIQFHLWIVPSILLSLASFGTLIVLICVFLSNLAVLGNSPATGAALFVLQIAASGSFWAGEACYLMFIKGLGRHLNDRPVMLGATTLIVVILAYFLEGTAISIVNFDPGEYGRLVSGRRQQANEFTPLLAIFAVSLVCILGIQFGYLGVMSRAIRVWGSELRPD